MESSNAKRGTISIVVQAHIEPSVTPGWRCFLLEFWQHTAPADRASATSGEAGAECRSNADGRWGDESTNTCDKLLSWTGGAETIGPILMGMSKPAHVLQRGREVQEIVNIAAVAVVDAQETEAALHAELKADKTAKNAARPRASVEISFAKRCPPGLLKRLAGCTLRLWPATSVDGLRQDC